MQIGQRARDHQHGDDRDPLHDALEFGDGLFAARCHDAAHIGTLPVLSMSVLLSRAYFRTAYGASTTSIGMPSFSSCGRTFAASPTTIQVKPLGSSAARAARSRDAVVCA